MQQAEPMNAPPNTAPRFAAVALLREQAQRVAGQVVIRAHAARELGATAEAYRSCAQELERQANRAKELLFGQAVETLNAAAAENRLTADALEAIENWSGEPPGSDPGSDQRVL